MDHESVNQRTVDWDRSPFSQGQWICSTLLTASERLPCIGTTYKKCMGGVCGLAQEAYMSCVSGFPCRMYNDSNHHDSRI
jgi:hypothetical protein